MNEIFKRQPEETVIDYILRMVAIRKSNKLTWTELAEIINKECDYSYSESYYRKALYTNKFSEDDKQRVFETVEISDKDDEVTRLTNILTDLRKERMRLSDERVQNNAYLRRITREESIKDIAALAAETISNKILLNFDNNIIEDNLEKEGLLLLSDWHYGMVCDSYWNRYNPEIAKKRISRLLSEVKRHCIEQNITKVNVLNLSDLISGRIHFKIRLESRIDVITQTIEVSEILAEFLTDLSTVAKIDYFDCLDNHSRLEPIKTDSLDLESLVRIIPWYLRTRLAGNSAIRICENKYSDDIICLESCGHIIYAVHGHKDTPQSVIKNLSMMLKNTPDLVCVAHRHHFSADEQNEILLIGNGSLMGSDSFATDNRLTAFPSQTFIVVTKENVADTVYRILLNKGDR